MVRPYPHAHAVHCITFGYLFHSYSHVSPLCSFPALAAGMMVSASFALVYESSGSHSSSSTLAPLLSEEAQVVPVWVSQAGGFALGAVFIILSQHYLHQHEDLKFAGLSGVYRSAHIHILSPLRLCSMRVRLHAGINAEKTLLLLAVMFFHSVSEGVSALSL